MFHDMGLDPSARQRDHRFEVDGANVARDFLRSHGIAPQDIDTVWTGDRIARRRASPEHMHPVVALVTAASNGRAGPRLFGLQRCGARGGRACSPRSAQFKEDIIRPSMMVIEAQAGETTFGNVESRCSGGQGGTSIRQFCSSDARLRLARIDFAAFP